MKKFGSHKIGIDQGDVVLFSDFEHNGVMWTGDGARVSRAHVRFSEPYTTSPSVRVGLSMWDISNNTNARIDIATEDVTESGFSIVFRTWGDTKVARVRVGWQAIGPVRDSDDWDIE
jgi:hypothetical protein